MELFEHQRSGAQWLADRAKGYLGDPPGEGKTLTLLSALDKVAGRALIACPAIVRSHWHAQHAQIATREPIWVQSYDMLRNGGMTLMREYIENNGVDTLILDEAHYLKHAGSQRTRLLLGKDGYARRVKRVWLSSGTPIPKHPGEYWTVMASVFPEIALEHGLRTYDDWMNRFTIRRGRMVRGHWEEKVVDVKNVEELQVILDQTMIRRVGGSDVPEVWWQQITLDNEGIDDYRDDAVIKLRAVLNTGLLTLEEIGRDPEVARLRHKIGGLKVDPVVTMLTEQLENSDEKVAVYAYHTDVIDRLAEGLRPFGTVIIDGRTSEKNRRERLEMFATRNATRIFIGQNTAAGTGMDGLQAATRRIVLVEPSWSDYENVQIAARVARRGATGHTVAQMISLANTVDDAVVAQCKREAEMARKIGVR